MTIARTVTFAVAAKNAPKVRKIVATFVDAVETEPGTLRYDSFETAPGRFMHAMVFKDAKAQKAHQVSTHCTRFVEALYPLCTEMPEFSDVALVAGAGLKT